MNPHLIEALIGGLMANIPVLVGGLVYMMRKREIMRRAKDRLNSLWYEYCHRHEQKYVALEDLKR